MAADVNIFRCGLHPYDLSDSASGCIGRNPAEVAQRPLTENRFHNNLRFTRNNQLHFSCAMLEMAVNVSSVLPGIYVDPSP